MIFQKIKIPFKRHGGTEEVCEVIGGQKRLMFGLPGFGISPGMITCARKVSLILGKEAWINLVIHHKSVV